MTGAAITGLGISLPEHVVTNAELAPRLGLTEEWISHRTGIDARRVASEGQTASTLGAEAGARALDAAGLSAGDIDLIVCATVTPDWRFPATACLIQSALGTPAAAFDINAGCSGFLYGLAQANAAVCSGGAQRALVVGCEVLSRITDFSDPKSAVLFGDGAGAAVVEASPEVRLGPFELRSDGSRPKLLYVPEDTGLIHMDGREVYRAAVQGMSSSVRSLLERSRTRIDEVDLLVAHQANQRILDAVAALLEIPEGKAVSNISRYGNTSAASIPIALYEAQADGRMREDDIVVLTAFGAGFAWGAGLVRWGAPTRRERALVATRSAHA